MHVCTCVRFMFVRITLHILPRAGPDITVCSPSPGTYVYISHNSHTYTYIQSTKLYTRAYKHLVSTYHSKIIKFY